MKRRVIMTLDDLVSEFCSLRLQEDEFTTAQFMARSGLSENGARDYLKHKEKSGIIVHRIAMINSRYVTAWKFTK
jgi:Fic family protein